MIKATSSDTAGNFSKFLVNESLIISGANFGIADLNVTGITNIDPVNKTLSIASDQTVTGYDTYRKINVTSLLVTDPVGGQLDLAGLYDVISIVYSGGIYTITLTNPTNTNINFSSLTESATENISASFTANSANIFLDGSYVVTGVDVDNKEIALATQVL